MKKILVIQTAFIGDVVLATALIEKLHSHYPDAAIDFLVRKGNEGLLTGHPYLRDVLVWNKKENKWGHLYDMLKQIRNKHYDTVINVQRFAATGLLTAFSGAKLKIGFDKNPLSFLFTKSIKHVISTADKPLHEVDRNQLLIASFTDDQAAKPRLYPSQSDFDAVSHLKRQPYIVVAPASVWFTKQYPPDKWTAFINRLPASLTVYLIGAPSDRALCEKIKNDSTHSSIEILAGKLNFLQSAALQQDAQMNFVNDSAPMHFASAMNAPVTAVYCSTLPSFGFGPLSDNRHIVEIDHPLDCRPCGLHGHATCPKGHFRCAYEIMEEQVLQTLDGF